MTPSPPEASPDTGREALARGACSVCAAPGVWTPDGAYFPPTGHALHDGGTLACPALSRSPERATADNDSKGEQ